ncbi:cobalt-precorrin 5A acetaldehyde-lyase [Natranaerovirga hydrolytica]|uniref:Cobalt-precorrin 5A acetaldehyde-lyase n=1 Tax=Natranaerovirga hydrolytica TaxID=680378 RepID=A0A4R1N165_9FIRM|nr:cobalt-precorrin 5A hydrolase [Natranaerovirga hydrolytica]TCK98652.1 cobalt-precorrin 5A acetaldehyde-lyase [Natranaerovirga hydrolytica]
MGLSILTLTKGGVALGKQLKKHYPNATLYTLEKYIEDETVPIKPSLDGIIQELFVTHNVLVFIMATGIVVRKIAPYLKDKTTDPAVIVMDEKGDFVISLLSGHLGKANEWAHTISHKIKATPVITTSSDLNHIMAVDTLAQKLQCAITDMKMAKILTVSLIEGHKVGVIADESYDHKIQKPYVWLDDIESPKENIKGYVYIGHTKPKNPKEPYLWLVPQDTIIGIGCKKGKTKEDIEMALEKALKKVNRCKASIKKIASVSIKKDEKGLLDLATDLNVPIEFYDIETIKTVEDQFKGSVFVQQTIGVKAVSEPCGYIGSNYGKCLVPVEKNNGITISLWEGEKEDNSSEST